MCVPFFIVFGRASLVPLESKMKVDERMRTLMIGLLELNLTGLNPDASCVACWNERYPTRITSEAETMHSRDESAMPHAPMEI